MTEARRESWTIALIATALVILMGLFVAMSTASAGENTRLDRKVQVMERVIDEVLALSPHVMVTGAGTTHGLVLDGFGALFVLEGAVGGEWLVTPDSLFVPGARLLHGQDPPPKAGGSGTADVERDLASLKQRQQEAEARRAEHLAGLRGELADALIDYGATLSELDGDDWVAIAAFLGSSRLFVGSDDDQRMLVKAKMRDLRQYAAGNLSREAVAERVVVEQ
jgi:hypothetical protein